jgi:hypothetical protein
MSAFTNVLQLRVANARQALNSTACSGLRWRTA